MKLLHRIGDRKFGSNFNTLEEILACNEPLSFDGVYTEVYDNREALKGRDITLFFCGGLVGKDNSFDVDQPYGKYCDWNQLFDLHLNYGMDLGYHSWSHKDLTRVTDQDELVKEIKPPFPMTQFAYPYGYFDDLVMHHVSAYYLLAWSVYQGTGHQHAQRRTHLNW